MGYPQTPLAYRLEIALGADLTADPDTYDWIDITRDLYLVDPIERTFGADDEASETNSTLTFSLRNPTGRYTHDNPMSDLWPYVDVNLPIRFSVNLGDGFGWYQRTIQYVTDIVDDWPSGTGNFCVAKVECAGRFCWMGQGRALVSAMRRASPEVPRVAYWPLEGGSGTVAPTSAIDGGTPMEVVGLPKFGERTGVAGSLPICSMQLNSTLYGFTGATPDATTDFCAAFLMHVDKLPDATVVLFSVVCEGGSIVQWDLNLDPDTGSGESMYLKAYAQDVAGDIVGATHWADNIDPNWLWVDIRASQNGADVDWTMSYTVWYIGTDGEPVGANYSDSGTVADQTISNITSVVVGPNGTLDGYAFGHVSVWNGTIPMQSAYNEVQAWAGESATQRIAGMCSEAGIPRTVPDSSDVFMGPQIVGTVLDNLRDSAKADHGYLDDSQGDVRYRCLGDTYNLDTSLTIDGVRRQLGIPFAPTRSNQKRRNSVTAKRPSGDGVTYEDAADIEAHGLFDGDLTVNISREEALLGHAQRAVGIGKASLKRYPEITIDLLRSPDLAKEWLACELGDRITIKNPPRQHARGDVDLHLAGGTERFGPGRRLWAVTLNGTPYALSEAFVREGAGNSGRRDAEYSTLVDDAASVPPGTSQAFDVTTNQGSFWTIDAAQFPIDALIAGERLRVDSIVGSGVTSYRSVGVAAHADNASVTPGMPTGWQVGDLLLLLAAIRNAGVGSINTPNGYTPLVELPNVILFGRIAEAGDAAPTVTFNDGVSGATCSARLAAFIGASLDVLASAIVFDGAAQNIATPALEFDDDGPKLVVWVGWKQDDWSSVAADPAGSTALIHTSTSTGDDQGIAASYSITSDALDIPAASFDINGGALAINRGGIVVLRANVQHFTVTRGIDGIRKRLAAGESVRLWHPGLRALY